MKKSPAYLRGLQTGTQHISEKGHDGFYDLLEIIHSSNTYKTNKCKDDFIKGCFEGANNMAQVIDKYGKN